MDSVDEIPLFNNKDTAIDVYNKLLDTNDVEIKTQLNINQIKVLTKIKWIAEKRKEENKEKEGMEILNDKVMPYYMTLMCSLKRQSRSEILKSLSYLDEKYLQEKGRNPQVIGFGNGRNQ